MGWRCWSDDKLEEYGEFERLQRLFAEIITNLILDTGAYLKN